MKTLIKGVLGLAAVALLFAFFATPFLTVNRLVKAARTGDAAALERLVDFPAFRDSLKEETTARLMAQAEADPRVRDSGLGGLGMMIAPLVVGGAIDALVTPQAIAAMVRTAEEPDPARALSAQPAEPEGDGPDIAKTYAYRDLNTFELGLTDRDRPERRLKLILKRHGPFGWRVSGVDLPDRTAP